MAVVENDMYSIGELARESGLSVSAPRFHGWPEAAPQPGGAVLGGRAVGGA